MFVNIKYTSKKKKKKKKSGSQEFTGSTKQNNKSH